MTNQNNAAQAIQEAERIAAADEYFKARTWLMDTNDNRRIFEAGFDRAYALLSKLRAPVADELVASLRRMASVAPASECEVLHAAASALASAPVAGEAQPFAAAGPLSGKFADVMADNYDALLVRPDAAPQASEAVRDAALKDAISILINLSARYRHNYDKEGCNSYHEGGADALDEAEQAIRAALSAQPGAQRKGGC